MAKRGTIMSEVKDVYEVIISIDKDRSVCKTLEFIRKTLKGELIFANGGDVTKNCREAKVCKKFGIKCVYGLGKKIQSSSWLLKGK